MVKFRVISAPTENVLEMLLHRAYLLEETKNEIRANTSAVALLQADLSNLYYYADLAQKAGNVHIAEISGSCPSRISVMALFGDISSVQIAIQAIEHVALQHDKMTL